MSYCCATVTAPMGGGARWVKSCGRLATDEGAYGAPMCRTHADEERYRVSEMDRLFASAKRHWKGFGFGIPGSADARVKCAGCDVVVPESEWAAHEATA